MLSFLKKKNDEKLGTDFSIFFFISKSLILSALKTNPVDTIWVKTCWSRD